MNNKTPGRPLRVYSSNGDWKDFSTDEIVGAKHNYYKNWLCGLGSDSLFINPDGDVYGASCKVGGKLGNVYEDFIPIKKWLVCTMKVCSCGSDLFIPKAKDESSKNLLRLTNQLPTENKRVDSLNDMVAMERTHSNYKQVYWEIGRRCNYDCSYCWPWIHNNYERHKTLEELITATMKVQEKFVEDSQCNFIISGGEPTANPAFMDWARYIKSFGYHLSMHSNGSRKPDYYQELIKYGDLNLSAHYEFWNDEKFLKVIEAVTETKMKTNVGHLEIKLMMKPGTTDMTLEFENKLKAIPGFVERCTWAIVPIRDGKMGDVIMEGYSNFDFTLFGDRKI
jgi:organic radical activating enzyme